MSSDTDFDETQLLELEQKYETIIASNPESKDFCLLAEVQYKLGKLDKATGVLVRGLTHNKNNVTARFLLGKIHYERWLIDQAKKEMKKVLELAPDYREAAILLSEIYKSEDKLNKALEVLEGVYVFHNEDENLVRALYEVKQKMIETEQKYAIKVFETPIESRKTNKLNFDDSTEKSNIYTDTMLNLYIEQGEFDKALEIIEHLYKNNDDKNAAIENLKKTKLNKMNALAGFESKD